MFKQIHAYYSGRVQGIGFRFTARGIAQDLGVCGWVKNLADGRVEIVAEAEDNTIRGFLQRLEQEFGGYIRDKKVDWRAAEGNFSGFTIH